MNPASIAETYWQLHHQPRDAWTFELDLRPFGETLVAMTNVEFHFDFGSPNAYLSHLVIPEIEGRTGVAFIYVPVLLGGIFKLTNNVSPVVANQGIRNKAEYQELEMQRFLRAHGITAFKFNPHFPVNTLQIMRAAIVAEDEGYLKAYADAVFAHMWAEPKKMDEPEIIKAALDQSGFDGAHILARTQEPAIKARLMENTEKSVARGTFGSPTFFVGDEIFFGKDRLAEVEAAIRDGVRRSPSRRLGPGRERRILPGLLESLAAERARRYAHRRFEKSAELGRVPKTEPIADLRDRQGGLLQPRPCLFQNP